MADEELPKEIADKQKAARQRVKERRQNQIAEANKDKLSSEELAERQQNEQLIGQLKAAEARNRIRLSRMRNRSDKLDELDQLMQCQPTAASAVRLEALLVSPAFNKTSDGQIEATPTTRRAGTGSRQFSAKKDFEPEEERIDKITRERIERLMNDELGLLTLRS